MFLIFIVYKQNITEFLRRIYEQRCRKLAKILFKSKGGDNWDISECDCSTVKNIVMVRM